MHFVECVYSSFSKRGRWFDYVACRMHTSTMYLYVRLHKPNTRAPIAVNQKRPLVWSNAWHNEMKFRNVMKFLQFNYTSVNDECWIKHESELKHSISVQIPFCLWLNRWHTFRFTRQLMCAWLIWLILMMVGEISIDVGRRMYQQLHEICFWFDLRSFCMRMRIRFRLSVAHSAWNSYTLWLMQKPMQMLMVEWSPFTQNLISFGF